MKEIPLTKGYISLIDDEDFEFISQHKWHISSNGNSKLYAATWIYENGIKRYIRMHQYILGLRGKCLDIDHKDGNGLNNRRLNLRICNRNYNNMNKPKYKQNATSIYKGVYRSKNKFIAQIQVNKKIHYLGAYLIEEDAANAYNMAAINYYGDFARLNEL